jgi:hypothetical protein
MQYIRHGGCGSGPAADPGLCPMVFGRGLASASALVGSPFGLTEFQDFIAPYPDSA